MKAFHLAQLTILLILGCSSAVAQGNDASKYKALPPPVVADVKRLEQECIDVDGTPKWSADDIISQVDFSPDHIPDYVISGIECEGDASPFVGSDGHRYVLLVSVAKNRWVRLWDENAHGFNIQNHVLDVYMHPGRCKKTNRIGRCSQKYVFNKGKLKLIREYYDEE